jgi:hypothetical protein
MSLYMSDYGGFYWECASFAASAHGGDIWKSVLAWHDDVFI